MLKYAETNILDIAVEHPFFSMMVEITRKLFNSLAFSVGKDILEGQGI